MKTRILWQTGPKLELNIFKSKYVLSEITGYVLSEITGV